MAKNKDQITVYPAYAGVILDNKRENTKGNCLSRIRGGDPHNHRRRWKKHQFIPHTRG